MQNVSEQNPKMLESDLSSHSKQSYVRFIHTLIPLTPDQVSKMPSRVRVVARVRPSSELDSSCTTPLKFPPQYSLSSPSSPISSVPSSRALSIDPISSKLVSYRPFAEEIDCGEDEPRKVRTYNFVNCTFEREA